MPMLSTGSVCGDEGNTLYLPARAYPPGRYDMLQVFATRIQVFQNTSIFLFLFMDVGADAELTLVPTFLCPTRVPFKSLLVLVL